MSHSNLLRMLWFQLALVLSDLNTLLQLELPLQAY